jgi:hypothetical protein
MGGYAPVIRATDYPASPASGGRPGRTAPQPGSPDRSADDVYVYRDPSARAGYLADQRAREREAAYWYDLTLDPAGSEREEARGPFEPMLPSSGPPPNAARQQPYGADAATAAPAGTAAEDPQAQLGAVGDEGAEEPGYAQARRLEQIKDLYLTAEAIGEENVDKHFDQLLAQQRELISEYFRQSAAVRHADALPVQADANPIEPRQPGGQSAQGEGGEGSHTGQSGHPSQPGYRFGAPEGAGVAAEPPRSW